MLGHFTILSTILALSGLVATSDNSHTPYMRFGDSENPYMQNVSPATDMKAIISTWPDEQKLIYLLLNNYDSAVRPVFNASKSVLITFSLSLIQISDMDEKNQILTSNVWLEQEWHDERLMWNQSDYSNLDKLRVPSNRLWLPDVVLYNSADDYNKGFMQSKVMIKPDGKVFWPLPIKLRSSCKIDVTYFPFDDQVCNWKFGSWTYSGLQVDLFNLKEHGDLTNYVVSGEWHLVSVRAQKNVQYYPCCPHEPYPDIMFFVTVRRRILHFLYNIIIPCVWLSVLSLIGFWLPPDSGEKISLGITVLLAFSVFMLLIAENIPATSETVPLIVIYLTFVMSLTSISIILTVFVSRLHNACSYYPPMSRGLYKFMTKKIAIYVGMGSIVRQYEQRIEARSANHAKIANLKKLPSHHDFVNRQYRHELKKCRFSIMSNLNQANQLCDHEQERRIKSGVVLPMAQSSCSVNCEKDHLGRSIRRLNNDVVKLIAKNAASEESAVASEWKLIGLIVDRVLFWSFSTSCTFCSIFLLVVLPILKNRDII